MSYKWRFLLSNSLIPLLEECEATAEEADGRAIDPRCQFLVFKEINDIEGEVGDNKSPSSRLGGDARVDTINAEDGKLPLICILATIFTVFLTLVFVFFQCFCPDAKLHIAFQCSKPEELIL